MITITLPTWLSQIIIWSWVVFSVGMAVGMVLAIIVAVQGLTVVDKLGYTKG